MGKIEILKNDRDFAAFKASKSFQTKLLKIRVHYSLSQNSPRFGFIVPKKLVPKVVDRNLLKRRIKTVLLRINQQIKPADILIFPQPALIKQTFAKLSEEVENLISQAKLWKS